MVALNETNVEVASDVPIDRHIHGDGTPEQAWRAWSGLGSLKPLSLDALVPPGARVVVVSPHPDDEVLGCGGALALLARAPARREVVVVGVTEGEASYPGSLRWTPSLLARTRREERREGLRQLGLGDITVSLGFPDGGIAELEGALDQALLELLRPGDLVFATWRHDGHPDHEAVARAASRAARRQECRCIEMPIWMWHWARPGDDRVPWSRAHRLALDADALARKRRAIAAHASQLQPVAQERLPAVLPDWALARLLRPFEVYLMDQDPA